MSERYILHESWGFLGMSHDGKGKPKPTFTIHDTLCCYRTVGLFRAEDYGGGYRSTDDRVRLARADADSLLAGLNA